MDHVPQSALDVTNHRRASTNVRKLPLVLATAACVVFPLAAAAQDGDPIELSAFDMNGDLDLPGRAPGPKTKDEAVVPPAVQSNARPEDASAPEEWFGKSPWNEWSRVTGNWGGVRTRLEDRGLTLAGSFRMDIGSVLSGGVSGAGINRRLVDLNATLDLDPLAGWKGGSIYADLYHYAGTLEDRTGSASGVDAIASDQSLDQLAELWFQQVAFDGVLRVKAGKIDANVDFAALPCATGFISANGSGSPALIDMPTYPNPATGVLAFVSPTERCYLGAGVFDGATHDGFATGSRGPATFFSNSKSDSLYFIGEAGFTWSSVASLGGGLCSAGAWHHTGDFDRFDGGTDEGTTGFYAMAQQQLARRDGDEDDEKGLFAFARLGLADRDVSAIGAHASCGLVWKGTFAGRDDDSTGIMLSYADLAADSGASGDETIVEAYYTFAATGAIGITPSIVWVSNPSGDSSLDDALLAQVSLKVAF